MSFLSLLLPALLFSASLSAAHGFSHAADLERARAHFKAHQCERVIRNLGRDQFFSGIEEESHLIEAHHLLGVCYFEKKQLSKSREEFKSILFLNPNFELDLFDTRPPLLEFFNQIKATMREKTAELNEAKKKALAKPTVVERRVVYRQQSPALAFLPFGVPQFENGDRTKGMTLAVSEAALLGLNVGAYWWKRSYILPHSGNLVLGDSKLKFQIAQSAQFVSLGLLAGVYAYGVIDAIWSRKPMPQKSVLLEPIKDGTEQFLQELHVSQTQPVS